MQKSNTQFLEILQSPSQTTQKIEESANIFLSKALSEESASREALESRQRSRISRKEFCFLDLMLCAPSAADAIETRKSNGDLGYVQFETIQLEHSSKSNQASKQAHRERKEEEE
jgi:hypothetical protein